jgi:hypothetical protein
MSLFNKYTEQGGWFIISVSKLPFNTSSSLFCYDELINTLSTKLVKFAEPATSNLLALSFQLAVFLL